MRGSRAPQVRSTHSLPALLYRTPLCDRPPAHRSLTGWGRARSPLHLRWALALSPNPHALLTRADSQNGLLLKSSKQRAEAKGDAGRNPTCTHFYTDAHNGKAAVTSRDAVCVHPYRRSRMSQPGRHGTREWLPGATGRRTRGVVTWVPGAAMTMFGSQTALMAPQS